MWDFRLHGLFVGHLGCTRFRVLGVGFGLLLLLLLLLLPLLLLLLLPLLLLLLLLRRLQLWLLLLLTQQKQNFAGANHAVLWRSFLNNSRSSYRSTVSNGNNSDSNRHRSDGDSGSHYTNGNDHKSGSSTNNVLASDTDNLITAAEIMSPDRKTKASNYNDKVKDVDDLEEFHLTCHADGDDDYSDCQRCCSFF